MVGFTYPIISPFFPKSHFPWLDHVMGFTSPSFFGFTVFHPILCRSTLTELRRSRMTSHFLDRIVYCDIAKRGAFLGRMELRSVWVLKSP